MKSLTLIFMAMVCLDSAWAGLERVSNSEPDRDCKEAPPLDYAGCKYDKAEGSTTYLRGMLIDGEEYNKADFLQDLSETKATKHETWESIDHCLTLFKVQYKRLIAEGKCKQQDERDLRKLGEVETDLYNAGYRADPGTGSPSADGSLIGAASGR